MFHIKQIYDHKDLLALGYMKIELMRYHLQYAQEIGINDNELIQYTMEQALSTASSRDNYIFIMDSEIVGMAQVEEQISDVDESPILFVHGIYIKPDVRNKGIGGVFLKYLCRKYMKRIECECWYGLPVSKLYEKAGFKAMHTRYMLPMSSQFYGSDQN